MTAQVIATPPGCYHTVESGGSIVAPPGAEIIFQIAEIDDEGNVGPIIDPALLETEVSGGDLIVTLPDGTVIVFQGLLPVLGQGSGIADASGTPVIDSPESAINPAAGAFVVWHKIKPRACRRRGHTSATKACHRVMPLPTLS